MKTVIASIILAASVSVSAFAQAEMYQDQDRSDLLKICNALQENDVTALRHSVRALYGRVVPLHVTYRLVARDLRCNGQDAIDFALHSQAPESAAYLATKAGMDLAEQAVK